MASSIPRSWAGHKKKRTCKIALDWVSIRAVTNIKKLYGLIVLALIALLTSGSLWAIRNHQNAVDTKTPNASVVLQLPPKPQKASRGLVSSPLLPSVATVEQLRTLYARSQEQLYNSQLGREYDEALKLLWQAYDLLTQLDLIEDERLYWLTQLEFDLGSWYQGAVYGEGPEAQRALPYYEKAHQLAQGLVQRAPEFSEGHRLLGESLMRVISLRGWFHALTHAGTAKEALKRALVLDPQNAAAHLALGVYYLYAPGLLGGNLEKAVGYFRQAEDFAREQTTRFLAHRWRGVAYAKRGEREKARAFFHRALEIYPKSGWDRHQLNKLKGR